MFNIIVRKQVKPDRRQKNTFLKFQKRIKVIIWLENILYCILSLMAAGRYTSFINVEFTQVRKIIFSLFL